jgi:hypothetical protein
LFLGRSVDKHRWAISATTATSISCLHRSLLAYSESSIHRLEIMSRV